VKCDRFCESSDELLGSERIAFSSPWKGVQDGVSLMRPRDNPHGCCRLHTPRRSLDFQYSTAPVTYCTDPAPHHVLVLLTAPRRSDTLGATLASLRAAGLDAWTGPKILLSDGPASERGQQERGRWTLHESPESRGCARAFVLALRLALAADPDLSSLTFVEDDVEFSRNTLSYVTKVVVPDDVAFLTWFSYDYDWSVTRHPLMRPTPAYATRDLKTSLLACRSARYFSFTQACTFPRRTVNRILGCPHVVDGWPKPDGHDEQISWALGDALYAAHYPVLVQHTGGFDSAVSLHRIEKKLPVMNSQKGVRQSPAYVGPEFDAMSLVR
jgi:hypothetical protein